MKCPICGKDLELQKKQIGTSENGDPIFNEYAICRDCKKQWNLDKQRARKMAAKKAAAQAAVKAEEPAAQEEVRQANAPEKKAVRKAEEPVAEKRPAKAKRPASSHTQEEHHAVEKKPVKKRAAHPAAEDITEEAVERTEKKPVKKRVRTEETESQHPAKKHVERRSEAASERTASGKKPVKKRHAEDHSEEAEERKYANVPSEKVRAKREKAVRKGYEDMLSTDPDSKSSHKKKSEELAGRKKEDKKELIDDYENENYDDDDYYDDDYEIPKFRPLRILLGILSLVGFGFCIYKGFVTGLSSTAADLTSSTGMVYVVLALCMLVSALLYFIMVNRYTIFSFLLPMLFYLASAVFGFLKRGDEMEILIIAGASAVLAILSLILAIASRGGDDYYEDEEEDDAFDDDDYED